jgi:nicotinamide riboside transporter PnuC
MRNFWYIWSKALGEKAHEDRNTADKVAAVRTLLIIIATVTNILISVNILRKW